MKKSNHSEFPIPPAGWAACNLSAVVCPPQCASAEPPAAHQDQPIAVRREVQPVAFQAEPQDAQARGLQSAPDVAAQVDISRKSAYSAPNSAPAPLAPDAIQKTHESTEMWFGKYATSVIAAVLVFIGLALLGSAAFPQLPDEVRVAIMFMVSGSLAAIGSVLELRRGNGLTLALMSCGTLSLFASTIVVRFSFGLVPEAIAFALILLLMTVRLLVGRKPQGSEGFVPDASFADKRFRIVSVAFASLVAAYECAFGFWFFPYDLGAVGAALLGACYVAMLGGIGALLLRLMGASSTGIVGYAVAFTVLLMSYLRFCTPVAGEGYAWSVCCMICALVCAIIGFRFEIGGLRLYGLILTLVCVVKLVMIDITGLNGFEHALAFVAGGLVCFGISALYHYAVKRLLAA